MKSLSKVYWVLLVLVVLGVFGVFGMIFFYVLFELEMGIVQKIFYVHVFVVMCVYVGFIIILVSSVFYFFKKTLDIEVMVKFA